MKEAVKNASDYSDVDVCTSSAVRYFSKVQSIMFIYIVFYAIDSLKSSSFTVGRFHSLGLTARTIACKINLHVESHCPQVNILRKPGVQLCERQDKSGNGKLVNFDQS